MTMEHWSREALFYHLFPLGCCGAPVINDRTSPPEPRLERLQDFLQHLEWLGADAVMLGPVFESSCHGYDSIDLFRVDRRLGEERQLVELVDALHARGIRVVLDAVFHHVGRAFWAFEDVCRHGRNSRYASWFDGLRFEGKSPFGDPFVYRGWDGHYDLVKLDLTNREVLAYLFDAVGYWIDRLGIDGLRLDAADRLDRGFMKDLARLCRERAPGFWLVGEMVHGDYRELCGPGPLDSATNYEVYKSLWSAHNDRNYFEIAHALNRQFGPGGIYESVGLYNFVDNHDVQRIASQLTEPEHLYPLHLLLLTMPGVPSIYYGSEWGIEGRKKDGDWALRPRLAKPGSGEGRPHPHLAQAIRTFGKIRRSSRALCHGDYRQLHVASEQLAFSRSVAHETVIVAVNASSETCRLEIPYGGDGPKCFVDRLDPHRSHVVENGKLVIDALPPRWGAVLSSSSTFT
jgi:cyclomaltodextrinase / maltogenic alpha-amylase / neopullulanase